MMAMRAGPSGDWGWMLLGGAGAGMRRIGVGGRRHCSSEWRHFGTCGWLVWRITVLRCGWTSPPVSRPAALARSADLSPSPSPMRGGEPEAPHVGPAAFARGLLVRERGPAGTWDTPPQPSPQAGRGSDLRL